MRDPRYYQIGALCLLQSYGLIFLDFSISIPIVNALIVASLCLQWSFTKLRRLPFFEPKSALISALSLCLLLRTDSLIVALAAAFIAVGSKFLIRWNGKHLFNPTNLALVIVLMTSESAWVSPGQWGQTTFFAFLAACFGIFVLYHTKRSDITLFFLAAHSFILIARTLWLNDPFSIVLHNMQNGGLLIFAFFMISDPKTTPDTRVGRLIFAVSVASIAAFYQHCLFLNNSLIYALATCAPAGALLDRMFPAKGYEWGHSKPMANSDGQASSPHFQGEPK